MDELAQSKAPEPAPATRATIVYKTVKSAFQLTAALVAVVLWPLGLSERMQELAISLSHHASHAWTLTLSRWLEQTATRRGVQIAIALLVSDGLITAVEAWALRRGQAWGAWLVICATGALLPFEVFELAREVSVARALILLVNAAIVSYLVRQAQASRTPHI